MARKARTINLSESTDRATRSGKRYGKDDKDVFPRQLDQLARYHRLARTPSPPAPLKSYALGAVRMTTLHVAVDDKAVFEAFRADLRVLLGFPVSQPGAFAVLVALMEAQGDEARRLGAALVATS